jgi:hypothetical protein
MAMIRIARWWYRLAWRKSVGACLWGGLLLVGQLANARPEVVEIKLPAVSGQRHLYFAMILDKVLRAAGHTPHIVVTRELPQTRVWLELQTGQIDLFWALQTSERDAQYLGAGADITAGHFGQRVLLVRKEDLPAFAAVKSLDNLRSTQKVCGFGAGWFDADIWKMNRLPYKEFAGDWTVAFKSAAIGGLGVDYLSRNVLEVEQELRDLGHGLVIEPTLLLTFDRDARFYLAPGREKLQKLLAQAFQKARQSGLLRREADQYYAQVSLSLNLAQRKRLKLATPPSGSPDG